MTIMTDNEWDNLALQIDPSVETGNKKMDRFFKEHFKPYTAMWIHYHPDPAGLARIYHSVWGHK